MTRGGCEWLNDSIRSKTCSIKRTDRSPSRINKEGEGRKEEDTTKRRKWREERIWRSSFLEWGDVREDWRRSPVCFIAVSNEETSRKEEGRSFSICSASGMKKESVDCEAGRREKNWRSVGRSAERCCKWKETKFRIDFSTSDDRFWFWNCCLKNSRGCCANSTKKLSLRGIYAEGETEKAGTNTPDRAETEIAANIRRTHPSASPYSSPRFLSTVRSSRTKTPSQGRTLLSAMNPSLQTTTSCWSSSTQVRLNDQTPAPKEQTENPLSR